MARVKQRDSVIETTLRRGLWSAGVRYRKHVRILGTPDLVIRSARVVVFVDSCFWHGCRRHGRQPKSNVEFWTAKIARNRERDRKVSLAYRRAGWTVVRVWEHEIKWSAKSAVRRVVAAIERAKANPRSARSMAELRNELRNRAGKGEPKSL